MKTENPNHSDHIYYMKYAYRLALKSPCLASKCGAIIVRDSVQPSETSIIGEGWNRPPYGSDFNTSRCYKQSGITNTKSDKHCCVHAEQVALKDALVRFGIDALTNADLYFIRVGLDNKIKYAGLPYCTICSKLALEFGIQRWILWHEEGFGVYDANEYNTLSFFYNTIQKEDVFANQHLARKK